MTKQLIVNADDFGLSPGVNRGIIEAAENGIVTSASLMVRQPAARAAAAYAQKNSRISIGLHLDLGEWVFQKDEWVPLYAVVPTHDPVVVADEIWRQLAQFQKLMDRPPTHIDSHQHVHREEPVRAMVCRLAERLAIPVREQTPGIIYRGDFYGQTGEGEPMPELLSVEALKTILSSLPDGTTELGCHPGYDDHLATAYRAERALEVKTLCSPEIQQAVTSLQIKLCSFSEFGRLETVPK
jgi:chitin disaccharide deacetylase